MSASQISDLYRGRRFTNGHLDLEQLGVKWFSKNSWTRRAVPRASRIRRLIFNFIRQSSLLRRLALLQFGNAIFMWKRS
jgi:hypothetical protein